jgi:hypothetical protein
MPDWASMLVPTIPLLEGVVRGTITFFALLALMRIVGQRESGGLGLTDVLIIVLVAEAAAPALHLLGQLGQAGRGVLDVVQPRDAGEEVMDRAPWRSPPSR